MENFQKITPWDEATQTGDNGTSSAQKINNLGQNALGPEHNTAVDVHSAAITPKISAHNTAANAHGDAFVRTTVQQLSVQQQNIIKQNLGLGGSLDGAVRYDDYQSLTSSETRRALENMGLPDSTSRKSDTELDDIIYTWWTWGVTDSEKVGWDPKRRFWWWQSYEVIDGAYHVHQTRLSGKLLQRRSKIGETGTWTAWTDIAGGTTLTGYREDWTSPDEATQASDGNSLVVEWGPIRKTGGTLTPASFLFHNSNRVGSGQDIIGSAQTEIFTDGTIRTRAKTPDQPGWGAWVNIGGDATTTHAGVVTLASNTGDGTDSGKVPVIQPNGKLHPNIFPGSQFTYKMEIDYNGNQYLPVLRIVGAANTVFTAKVKLTIQSMRTYANGDKEAAYFEHDILVQNNTATGTNFDRNNAAYRLYKVNSGSLSSFSPAGNDIRLVLPDKFINSDPTDQSQEYGYDIEVKEIFFNNQINIQ